MINFVHLQRRVRKVSVIVLSFASLNSHAQSETPVDLFSSTRISESSLNPRQTHYLNQIRNLSTTKGFHLVKIADGIEHAATLRVHDLAGSTHTLVRDRVIHRSQDDFSWIGTMDNQPGSVTLVLRGNDLTGTLWLGNTQHKIWPLGDGMHVFVEVDPTKYPSQDCFAGIESQSKRREIKPIERPGDFHHYYNQLRNVNTTLDVMVVYTTDVSNAVANVPALIQTAIDESNVSYSNSQVNITLSLVHTAALNYTEADSHYVECNRVANPNDGFMDNVPDLRETYNADIVVLLLTQPDLCGIASSILATPNDAYCTVKWDCATGNYSFGHEIGHLMGARHNEEEDPTTTPFAYGHGYRDSVGLIVFRTMMSVSEANITRIQYWSNPDVFWFGEPTGTVSTNDNARVLTETTGHLSNFRGMSLVLNDNIAWAQSQRFLNFAATASHYVGTNTITASDDFDIANNEDVILQVTNTGSGSIKLLSGFKVDSGGGLRAFINATVNN